MVKARRTTQRQRTALLALAAVSAVSVDAGKLRARQYPADAPACARICIAAKIAEVVDPGLATSCDGTTGAAYISCVCGTSKFTRAYDTCLTENCVFPADLAAGRELFTTFCNSPSEQEISSAMAVASQAIASQSSVYAAESRTAASSSTTVAGSSAVSSTGVSSGASSSSSVATTGTTTSSGSVATSGTSSSAASDSTSTGTSRPASGTSSTTSNASQTTSAVSNTSSGSPRSSGTLGAAAVASALANATGVSAANYLYAPALFSTFGCAALAVFFHALL